MKRLIHALWLGLFLLASPARAEDCPVDGVVAVEKAITDAQTCAAAGKIFGACGFGSTIDVKLGRIVIEKCEVDFLSRLNVAGRRSYERAQKRCEQKYAQQDGSMYRSAAAFCRTEVAEKHSRRSLASRRRR